MDQIYSLAVSATAWLPAMAEATLRTSGILLVSAAIAFALRGGPATLRHLVWALALVGVLLAPVGRPYLPAIDLPVPSLSPALTAAAESGLWSPGVSMRDRSPGPGPTRLFTDVPMLDAAPTPPTTVTSATVADVDATGRASPAGVASVPRRLTSVQRWSFAALGLWFAGAAALLSRIGLGLLATRRLGRAAAPPSDREWRRLATELTAQLGLTRPVQVLSSPRAAMPMTWGCRRPVVLVPATGTWPTARKRVVLLHELSHVKRYDCAWQFVANLALSLHWFNPLVWLAVRAQRVERERACDDAVVHAGTSASSYADHLLEIARSHREPRWSVVAAVAMARRSQLEGRLLSILAPGRRLRAPRRTALAVTVVMMALIGSLTALTPSAGAATSHASSMAGGPVGPIVQPLAAASRVAQTSQAPPPSTPVAPASQTPAPDVEAAMEQVAAEVEEYRRARDERSRVLSSAEDQDSQALEVRRDELAREMEALEARTRALVSQSEFLAPTDDLEHRLREIREGAAQFMNRQRELGNELGRLGIRETELVERALEQARDLHEIDLDRVVDGVAIAEDVRVRVRDELARVHARFSVDQPLDPRVVELLVESLSDAVDGLVRALADTAPGVVRHAVAALGRIRDPAAVEGLVGALAHADMAVVQEAAQALGRIRGDAAVDGLATGLRTAGCEAAKEIVRALGRIGGERAVDALIAATDDASPAVRKAVIEALSGPRWGNRVAAPVARPRPDVNPAAAPDPN